MQPCSAGHPLEPAEAGEREEKGSRQESNAAVVTFGGANDHDDDAQRFPRSRRHGHRGGAIAMGPLALRCNPPPPFSKSPGSLLLLSKSLTLYC